MAVRRSSPSLGQERLDDRPKLLGTLHDLRVLCPGENGEAAVGKEVEHVGRVVQADEVSVTDDHERRCRTP